MSILGSLLGGGSNRPEPSETMQSNAGGLMSKFNPFNLVSGMFGGRKAGAADNYAKTPNGMRKGLKESKKKDPKFVSKAPRGDMPIQKGDSASDIAARLYNLIKTNEEKKKKELQVEQNFAKSLASIKEKRNQELIKALTERPKDLKKETKQIKKESSKVEKQTKEAKKEAPKGKEPAKETPKTKEPTKVKREKPSAAPAPTIPSTAPATPIPAAPAISTTAKLGIGAGLAAGVTMAQAADVATKISSGETGKIGADAYIQANRPAGIDPKESKIKKGNIDVTTGKPFTKNLTEMTIAEVIDLGRRRGKHYVDAKGKSIGGSALGKYQFIPDTLADTAKKLYGENWKTRIYDEKAQEELNTSLIMSNADKLKQAGVPISDASLYMMHFFGNPVQAKMVVYGKDSDSMMNILDYYYNMKKQKVKPSKQNPSVAKMTVGEYKKRLRDKGFDFKTIVDVKQNEKTIQQPIPKQGETLNKSSTENKDLKQQTSSTSGPVVVNNNNNIIAGNQQMQTMVQSKSDASRFIQGVRV